jgi:hypothetical protein
MANKKKDKKRKQRKARKSKLPSSVEALLGYLGGGGPGPAPQGDTKVRERAGVDSYDTLHQIIKSQQMMSANYMQNLQQVAFKTEFNNKLDEQGVQSRKALDETKEEMRKKQAQAEEVFAQKQEASEKVLAEAVKRGYNFKTPEEKLIEIGGQLKHMLKTPEESRNEVWTAKQKQLMAKADKYKAVDQFNKEYLQPVIANASADVGLPPVPAVRVASLRSSAVAGGGVVAKQQKPIAEPAPAASARHLPATKDLLIGLDVGGGGKTLAPTSADALKAGASTMISADQTSSSLTPAVIPSAKGGKGKT